MRQDRAKTVRNASVRRSVREAVKAVRTKPTKKSLTEAFQKLDKAAKSHVIHKNRASRLKSRLSKLLS